MRKETKTDPSHTSGEGRDRPTAETIVTDGSEGMVRLKELVRRIIRPQKPGESAPSPP